MSQEQLTSPWFDEHDAFLQDNVDPEILKIWKEEFHKKDLRDMRHYLKQFPDATPEEKKALRRWVNSGHSPYENGDYIVNDDGGPMDFINALRFWEVQYQAYLNDPDAYQKPPDDSEEYISPKFDPETGEELPF